MPTVPNVTVKQQEAHLDWLMDVTALPTAAGCEDSIIAWIENWLSRRSNLELKRDKAGNLIITRKDRKRKLTGGPDPIYITAHLDHPAFVVNSIKGNIVDLEFRGGVNELYFKNAKIEIFDSTGKKHNAVISSLNSNAKPFKRVKARLDKNQKGITPGNIGRWKFPKPVVKKGILHTNACDDLAAVVAAVAVMDVLHTRKGFEHVGLLLTRAEEIGFIGAIASCKLKSVPKASRLICLENSRSFPESPIGAGPILRVGDRISVFEPSLTNRITDLMLDYAKKHKDFKWQRKLMPGGACEATAFASYGYRSTCICLPLGNYHNMSDIDGVITTKKPARVGREYISIEDFSGLIRMLLVCCAHLDADNLPSIADRMEKLLRDRGHIVGLQPSNK